MQHPRFHDNPTPKSMYSWHGNTLHHNHDTITLLPFTITPDLLLCDAQFSVYSLPNQPSVYRIDRRNTLSGDGSLQHRSKDNRCGKQTDKKTPTHITTPLTQHLYDSVRSTYLNEPCTPPIGAA